MIELMTKGYVDLEHNINSQTRSQFFEEYPLFKTDLESGKVKDRNKVPSKAVKIRKAQFEEIQQLWSVLNQNYIINYDSKLNNEVKKTLDNIFKTQTIFSDQIISSRRDEVSSDGEMMSATSSSGVQYTINQPLPYGLFLKRVSASTNISVKIIHEAICKHVRNNGKIKPAHFNEQAISRIIQYFSDWKISTLQGRFNYKKTKGTVVATALTHADGSVKDEITQGRIGVKIKEGDPAAKYLYDSKAFDSPLELDNIEADIDGGLSGVAEVVVYGKIPRSSIQSQAEPISPDFMYVVKRENGEKELNIVVETKDVENKSTLRGIEEAIDNNLSDVSFPEIWDQSLNILSQSTLNNLINAINKYDFAIFVFGKGLRLVSCHGGYIQSKVHTR